MEPHRILYSVNLVEYAMDFALAIKKSLIVSSALDLYLRKEIRKSINQVK